MEESLGTVGGDSHSEAVKQISVHEVSVREPEERSND